MDYDISCPIPYIPESIFGEFNWFLSFIRHARLLSRAYTSLFSAGVSGKPRSYYLDTIAQLTEELEEWRMSLPDTGFQPKGTVRPHAVSNTRTRPLALHTHYFYYGISMILARTALLYLPESSEPAVVEQRNAKTKTIIDSSRAILDLTPLIEVEPYTSSL